MPRAPGTPRAALSRMRSRIGGALLAALVLALTLLVQADASRQTSAVVDEPAHLTAGYLSLVQGDHAVNKEHPPLLKMLAALPLLWMDPVLPEAAPGAPPPGTEDFEFYYSREFLYKANRADRLLQAARLPMMILTLLLGSLIFVWIRELAGLWPALASLALYGTEPGILAHGRLVTTDLGSAAFLFGTLWALRMVCRSGSLLAAVACGLFLGAAILSKFSALLILPVGAALVLADRFLGGAEERRPGPFRLLNLLGLSLFIAWLGLLLAYGFGGFPVPDLYVQGLELARIKNATVEGPTYLMGRISAEGFRSYYLIALLVKTPIPLLLLGLAGGAISLALPAWRREAIWILLPAAAWFAAMTILTRAQIGVRYVLPVVPALCMAAGLGMGAIRPFAAGRLRAAAALVPALLIGWQAAALARVHPYHLAYFNEAAGGPAEGWRWLVDSNLDWGQDLKGLREWQEAAGDPVVNLYYFGTADPDYYGIRKHPYGRPRPGLFAVSATHLAGVYLPDPDLLAAFRDREPVRRIGWSILIFDADQVPGKLMRGPAR